MHALLLVLSLLAPPSQTIDFNIFRNFKPASEFVDPFAGPVQIPVDPRAPAWNYGPPRPHTVAVECAEDDDLCIMRHDDTVLTIALVMADPPACDRSTKPRACHAAYTMIVGDATPTPWKGLDDPCTFVVRVDQGVATLYWPRAKETRRVVTQAPWAPAAFIGACDVATIGASTAGEVRALPKFPWSGP
jgi:hypothetical protein